MTNARMGKLRKIFKKYFPENTELSSLFTLKNNNDVKFISLQKQYRYHYNHQTKRKDVDFTGLYLYINNYLIDTKDGIISKLDDNGCDFFDPKYIIAIICDEMAYEIDDVFENF